MKQILCGLLLTAASMSTLCAEQNVAPCEFLDRFLDVHLDKTCQSEMVRKTCRSLSGKYHPDKYPQEQKRLAEKLYFDIRNACDAISQNKNSVKVYSTSNEIAELAKLLQLYVKEKQAKKEADEADASKNAEKLKQQSITALEKAEFTKALRKAVKSEDSREVQSLLIKRFEKDLICGASDEVLLFYVATLSSDAALIIAELLIKYGAEINMNSDDGFAPLALAAARGTPQMVALLLKNGAYVDVLESAQYTPLAKAAENCVATDRSLEIARILLSYGAAPDGGGTFHDGAYQSRSLPLVNAAVHNCIEWAELVMDQGASVDAVDSSLGTALDQAVMNQNADLVRLLLHHGASANVQTGKDKSTALHKAAKQKSLEIVRLLLESGARVDIEDADESKPVRYARGPIRQLLIDWARNHPVESWQSYLQGYAQKAVEYIHQHGSAVGL